MELGPGERLVLRALLVIGKYPASIVAAAYVLNHFAGWAIPTWAVCVAVISIIPLVVALRLLSSAGWSTGQQTARVRRLRQNGRGSGPAT